MRSFATTCHGLEIDERCCQIAAFALAFAAWTYPGCGGYRLLPELHIACTGIGPQATEEQWLKLAEETAAIGHMPAKSRPVRQRGIVVVKQRGKPLESARLFLRLRFWDRSIDPAPLPAGSLPR